MMFRYGVFDDARVIEALRAHFESAYANTAPGGAHAVEIAALKAPQIRFWTAWDEGALLATGALNWFTPRHAEIRAMYVVESMRRRGMGGRMLRHLIADARAGGAHQLWLETGSWDYFRPAIEMYLRHGFTETGPFADYVADPNAMFMMLDLRE